MRLSGSVALLLMGISTITGTAMAQTATVLARATGGTQSDYARADALPARVAEKRVGGVVRPQWLGNTGCFWYEQNQSDGRRQWFFVNADKKTRLPAFDHARLAAALSAQFHKPVDAVRLPLDRIAFLPADAAVPEQLRLRVAANSLVCDLRTYTLRPDETPLGDASEISPARALQRGSGAAGEDTNLTFTNQTAEPVRLFWVSEPGQRQAYGTLAPGASRTQHTFAGHVWLVTRERDDTPLTAFVAGDTPSVARIDTTKTPAKLTPPPGVAGARQAANPFVSPDGKWRVLLDDHNVQLRALSSNDSEAPPLPLTTDGKAEDTYEGRPIWSPDSRFFVLYQTIPGQERKVALVESSPRDQLQPKLDLRDYLKPGDRIDQRRPRLFDTQTKRAVLVSGLEPLVENTWSVNDIVWEPTSESVTFLVNQRGHQVIRLVSINAATGTVRTVIEEKSPTFIDYTNKVFLERLPKTHEAIWMSERDGWNHLYLYDTVTGRVKNQITKGLWVVRDVERVDQEQRQVWFRAGGIVPGQDPYYVHYCRVNFDGTGLKILTEGDGNHTVTLSPNRRLFVDTLSRVDLPPTSVLRDTKTGARILDLETGDDSGLRASGWLPPERFVAKGRDGKTDIYGVLFRPSNFDPKRHYPVVESIYAGPQGAFVPKSWSPANQAQQMAELGFVVAMIDGMGTNQRSKAFHDVCWKNLVDAGLPDRILWLQAAAKNRTWMDLTRVGIYGTSAGGQNALGALLTHGDFYRVGVADCGCHDNRMDKIWWNEQWMGWPVGPEYASNSNVTLAPNLHGKLLLMVGEMDTNVDPASTLQVANALIKADKDFELLVMPGVGHGTTGTPYGRRRLRDFLVRNLLGTEPRAVKAPSTFTSESRNSH